MAPPASGSSDPFLNNLYKDMTNAEDAAAIAITLVQTVPGVNERRRAQMRKEANGDAGRERRTIYIRACSKRGQG